MSFFYQNITIAREFRGLTQSALASRVKGLSQGNLSRMEKGLLDVQEKHYRMIAEVLEFPLSFFSVKRSKLQVGTFNYRKRASVGIKKLAAIEAKFDIICSSIDQLLESIDIPSCGIPAIEPNANLSPEDIAYRLRTHLRIERGPINNLVEILESNGIIVLFISSESDKFDGVSMITNDGAPIVFVNEAMPNDRKRFTIAHELGHIVMHNSTEYGLETDDDQKEKEANRFASEFMLPKSECLKQFNQLKYQDLGHFKLYWKMSKASIINRAKNLGCITESQYKYYNMQLSAAGERKQEREVIDIDNPTIVSKMLNLHYSELEYSSEEMENILGLYDSQIKGLLTPESKPLMKKIKLFA